jgi:CRP-like cAMP-binding protein
VTVSHTQFASFPLFKEFTRSELWQLATFLTERQVEDGEIIMRQGTGKGGFFIVLTGTFRIVRELPGGLEYVVGRISKGNVFGHYMLIDGLPRNATIRAEGACSVAEMAATEFRMLLSSGGPLQLKFQQTLARDIIRTLRIVNKRFTHAATMPLSEFLTLANIEGLMPDTPTELDDNDLF